MIWLNIKENIQELLSFDLVNTVRLSIIELGIFIAFQEGPLSPVRIFFANLLDRFAGMKWSKIIQKPLWNCLTCMSSVWTIIIQMDFNPFEILILAGLNFMIAQTFVNERG